MNAKLFLDVENWFQKFNCFLLSGLALAAFLFGITARAAEPQLVHASQPWVAARLTPISPLGENNRLNLAIALPLRNESALSNLLQQIYDPASPNFHHFLTPEQFTEQFGPSEADYQAVVDFAKASGFQVTATHPNRMLLDVNGPVSAIEKALHVTMHLYQHPTENRTFYAPDTDPTVDLSVPLLHISGLNNYELPHPRLVVKPLESGQSPNPNAGSGPGGTYMGKDFRAAYVPDTSLNGSGQTVGLLQFDGYTSNDIAYYEQKNGLPAVTLTNVLLDGFGGRPTGDGGEVEVSLDIELSISMATNLSKVIVYEAGPNGDWHDILNRMATDDLAKQLSCSWYNPGGAADPVADQIWQEMAMQGQSFLNASGDDDAYTGLISFPGDSPYITQVGGTTLNTTGPAGSWVSESVWNWEKGIGSGGGVSAQYPIPGWQTNVSMAANQGSTTMRNTPDVALTADNVYVRADGFDYNVGGTSCAAPLWAGFTALVNQEAVASGQSTVGFLNPLVYAIGGKAAYTADFHDIITGNNESPSSPDKFSAVPGYDLCTGWGTPAGQKLIDALANPEPLIITPAAGFSSIGGVGGPFTVTYESFTLTNAGTNNLTWTLANTSSWLNVSSVGGALTAGGPATNLIVSLNTVASNLTLGTYTATIAFTNLNDNIGQAREFSLDIIAAPEITLQPTNEAVLDGDSVTFAAQTAGGVPQYYQWQFDGTNLVDGDGIFGSESTNLVITVASTNDVGVYNLVVSNAAGVLVSSNADLSLILSPPIITEQPANETAGENSTAEFSISAVGTKPIAYQWIFNETNIIDGATNAALILSQVQFTNAGDYSVTLTNIYGSTNSAPAVLTVTPCDPAPSGIVSWWAGESNAIDEISGNNGTLMGQTSYGTGEVGHCFVFTGNNGGGVVVGNPYNLQLQNFSIECWIKRASTSIDSQGSPNGEFFSYGLYGYTFGIWNGQLYLSKLGVDGVFSTSSITDTNWHHVAVTKSGTDVVFYIDGTSNSASTYSTTFIFNTPAAIGTRGDDLQTTFYGSIDELSIYNRALSPTEIQDIYIAGSSGKCFTPLPPTITTQPTNQTVYGGQDAVFSVSAAGTPPLGYQWTFDTTNIPDATNSSLVLNDVQFTNAGNYAVIVSNSVDSILSSNAVLTVNPPPPCDPTPSGIVSWWAAEGNAADQISSYNGTLVGNVTYGPGEVGQAFVFDGNGSGVLVTSNSPNLQVQNFTIENWIKRASTSVVSYGSGGNGTIFGYGPGGYYFCMNSLGQLVLSELGDSDFASGQTITDSNWHHVAVTMTNGTVTFYLDGVASAPSAYNVTFTFTGGPGIGYRPDNDDNSFYGSIDEMSVYDRALSQPEIQAIYDASLSGKCFTPVAPTITTQPTNQTVYVGQNAVFSVLAAGSPPLGYQWTFDTTNIPNATNASLVLDDVQFTNAGNYAVIVSNEVSSVLSSNAVLTVNPPPPCAPVPPGIVSWWAAENNAIDEISGNNGTLMGQTSYGIGEVGQCFVFTGNDGDGVVVGNPTNLQLQNFSIECWIKRASASIDSQGSPNGEFFSYGLYGYTFGIWNGQLYLSKMGVDDVMSASGITDTSWHHVAATKSGTDVVFYIDGTSNSAATYSTTFVFDTPAAIGTRGDDLQTTFYGSIDEMSIYSNILTSAQIQAIYLAGNGGKCFTPVAPTITTQPTNQTVYAGQTAAFSVTASGTQPLYYQWTFDSTNIPDATNASFVLDDVQLTNAGNYAVIVSNAVDSILSSNAMLTVNLLPPCDPVPPGIVSWWAGESNAIDEISGNNGTLMGQTSYGTGEVGHGFVFTGNNGDGVVIGNPTNLQLQNFTIEGWIKRASASMVSKYSPNGEIFSYGMYGYTFGMWNNQLYLSKLDVNDVTSTSTITDTNWHHVAVTKSGTNVVFYIDGVPNATTYSTTFIFDTPAAIGTEGDNLQTTFYGSIDELSIYSNILTSAQIQAIYLAGSGGKCFTPVAPTITAQPTNQTVYVGQTAAFSVAASGTQPLYYQWTFDATNIPDATNASFILNDVQFTNAGNYAVIVSNEVSSVLSSNAVLTVNPPPPCDPVPSGIVSWWAAEGNAYDQISGNNGSLTGAVSYVPGEVGQAFQFSADQAVVQLENLTNLWLQNFTIECWIKRTSSSLTSLDYNDADLFTAGLDGYGFGIFANGNLFLTKIGIDNVSVNTGLTDTNSWHHVAVTKNGSAVIFYLDGVAYSAPAYTSTFQFNEKFGLGGRGDNAWNSFYGGIDEMSVYNRALGSNEVAAIYEAGSGGKCFTPTPPTITLQPTNETVSLGQSAIFSVGATNTFPLTYQWTFNTANIRGATNLSLTVTNAQFTNAGNYAVIVSNPFTSVLSSNALLTVNDILDYFTWATIPSPQFVNAPFNVTIQAIGTTNELLTNFNGTASLGSTNGIPVSPAMTTNFVQGVWTGNVTVLQPANNLVLLATNAAGPIGLANPITVFNPPALGYTLSGSFMLMYWPVIPSNFVLQASSTLSPPQWAPVPIPPLEIGDEYLESIEMTGTNQFYRLQLNGN